MGIKCFRDFCTMSNYFTVNGFPPTPTESVLEYFVTHCASNLKLSYTTIKLYLCGVRHHYIAAGQGDILQNVPRLDLTLRGIKKVQISPARIRLPITTDVLYALGSVLTRKNTEFKEAMLWAVLCIGFYGALRCGEFTVKGAFEADKHLCYRDVSFSKDMKLNIDYVVVHLKASKTDPFRLGVNISLFATGQLACPVQALRTYLSFCNEYEEIRPLFHLQDGTPLSRSRYISMLQVTLTQAVYIPTLFNGHSLRKGFATSASAGNVPDHVISTIGRWTSECYKIYISTPNSVIARAQQQVADPKLGNNL